MLPAQLLTCEHPKSDDPPRLVQSSSPADKDFVDCFATKSSPIDGETISINIDLAPILEHIQKIFYAFPEASTNTASCPQDSSPLMDLCPNCTTLRVLDHFYTENISSFLT